MNLAELLIEQAAMRPQHIAILDLRNDRGAAISFAELNLAAAKAARLLYDAGLRRGDAVVVFQPMSIDLYVALAAIFRLGLVAMFLDPSSGREHIEQCCSVWRPKGIIACPKAHLLRFVSAGLRQIPIQFSASFRLPWARSFLQWREAAPLTEVAPCAADAPALVTFTTGNTGRPKAALRTHGFLLTQLTVLQRALQLEPGERDLTTLPTFGLANLASGVTTVIPNVDLKTIDRFDAAALVPQIVRHHVDRIGAAPAFLERLATFCQNRQIQLGGLRKIFTGGGPVFPQVLNALAAVAPAAQISALYGCTEAEPISLLRHTDISPRDHEQMARGGGLLAGHIAAGLQARIIPDRAQVHAPASTEPLDAANHRPDDRGEIVVSGAHVLETYLDARDNALTKLHVEGTSWHRTGDAGYIDPQGRLWLLGRCAARLQDGLGTVYPLEIESAVRELTRGNRAALVSRAGQRVLCIEQDAVPQLENLRSALDRWHIDRIHVLDRLPCDRRHRSKIDYAALAKTQPCREIASPLRGTRSDAANALA